jgi:hypothetical protein
VRLSFIVVPLLIVLGGVITFVMLPLEGTLRALILAMDVFAASAVGLILWRQRQR